MQYFFLLLSVQYHTAYIRSIILMNFSCSIINFHPFLVSITSYMCSIIYHLFFLLLSMAVVLQNHPCLYVSDLTIILNFLLLLISWFNISSHKLGPTGLKSSGVVGSHPGWF